jgi:CubicO group peptidase (beta-lactamase class C family)
MACSFGRAALAAEPTIWPAQSWVVAAPAEMGMDSAHLEAARQYALTGAGSGIITRHGRCVLQWGDQQQRYDLKSTTKSFGATALGLAIADNKMQLTDAAIQFLPSLGLPPDKNGEPGWLPEIKIWHLATQTAGFAKPGGCEPLLFRPGTEWHYSDGGPNWLADCLTKTYRQDLSTLMFRRVFTPIGITKQDLSWRRNAYRDRKLDGIERREFGSGISANVNAMARLGYLYLRNGRWKDKSILPASYVDQVRTPYPPVIGLPEHAALHGNASDHYGLLWWNNADGTLPHVPRDAYWSWGLYDSVILVVPSLDMVVARAGRSWKRAEGERHYDVLAPFFNAIVESVQSKNAVHAPPYPPSPVIAGIRWAPADSIERQACGSDNWPMTWADDDQLYTAYGDGFGFEPPVDQKLSLGFARVTGMPPEFSGHNIRSPSGERKGDGKTGIKASGLLMVDGVLLHVGSKCLECSVSLVARSGSDLAMEFMEIDHQLWLPDLSEFLVGTIPGLAITLCTYIRRMWKMPIRQPTKWCWLESQRLVCGNVRVTSSLQDWIRTISRFGRRRSANVSRCLSMQATATARASPTMPDFRGTYGVRSCRHRRDRADRGSQVALVSTTRRNHGVHGPPFFSRAAGMWDREKQAACPPSGLAGRAETSIWCFLAKTVFPYARGSYPFVEDGRIPIRRRGSEWAFSSIFSDLAAPPVLVGLPILVQESAMLPFHVIHHRCLLLIQPLQKLGVIVLRIGRGSLASTSSSQASSAARNTRAIEPCSASRSCCSPGSLARLYSSSRPSSQ